MARDEIVDHLPLTSVAFDILLALAPQPRHGYAILQDVQERSGGETKLHPGTLYRALSRLEERGLLEEVDDPDADDTGDDRRRVYRLTALGRSVAAAEARRLHAQIGTARERELLQAPET